ncbi:endonuclease [Myroides albus]|nr:endonuclease [Myroides albus]UVD78860.1 endonuclease [Myroides albus]
MKKISIFLVLGMALAIFSCTKDPIVTDPTDIENPETTNPEKPNPDPTDPDPNTPIEVKPGKTVVFPGADFEVWDTFLGTLQDYQGTKIKPYATQAIGTGWDNKNGLSLKGTPSANDYVFTVENVKKVVKNATKLSLLVKGTSAKSLTLLVFKPDGKSYYAYNVGDMSDSKNITADTKPQTSDPNSTTPSYTGIIDTKGKWVKVVLDLKTGVTGYNTTGTGKTFAIKVGKDAAYDLVIDEIRYEDGTESDAGGDGEPGTDPVDPGDYKIPADQKAYYSSINFKDTKGMALYSALADLVKKTHHQTLGYTNKLWEAMSITDLVPNTNEVYLIYGHPGVKNGVQAFSRNKANHGGNKGQWNREHTYARALGTPNLKGNEKANSDVHHLRPADVEWNGKRDNEKFAKGSGLSGPVSGGWYPGDEWKGDVARMMMYMYLNYDNQCLPTGVAIGPTNKVDPKMVDMLLDWNAEDKVSDMEKKRNEYHGGNHQYSQGNRNPFIDNPYLATQIWGGKPAENLWK